MKIDLLLKRLNDIDEMLLNQYHIVTRRIGGENISFREPKYSYEIIKRIGMEKTSIIKKLHIIGLITDDEMDMYWLSSEYSYTPRICYDGLMLN